MKLYKITICGCDNDTSFILELTENQYNFTKELERISIKTKEETDESCMPIIIIEDSI